MLATSMSYSCPFFVTFDDGPFRENLTVMFGLYTPVLIFQIFCLYHAYRRNAEQRWYWLILFFPLGGSIIYLAYNFGSRTNLEKISETVKGVVNTNYRSKQLELALQHSENITNRVNLADEYCNLGRFDEAVILYKRCLEGFMADDPALNMKLIRAYFLKQDYASIIPIAEMLRSDKSFLISRERAAYAWSLHHVGKTAAAKSEFESLDKPYTNYEHRLEYCKYLEMTNSRDELAAKIQDLAEEFRFLKGPERKIHRNVIREIEDLHQKLSRLTPAKS